MSSYFEKKERQGNRDDKPSWRERDAKKSGKTPYSSDDSKTPKKTSHQEKVALSQAKSALDSLFVPKKNAAQEKDWKILEASRGRQFQTLAQSYIQTHGLPRVWDDLLHLLDMEDPQYLEDVLQKLHALHVNQTSSAKTLACAKLRMAKLTQEDPDLHEKIDLLISDLS